MPNETQQAINWALTQSSTDEFGQNQIVTKATLHWLVHYVREFFNIHNIPYSSFSYDDLVPFI